MGHLRPDLLLYKRHLTSIANASSTTNFTGFDALGHVLASNQITAGQTYSFVYGYKLAGALNSERILRGALQLSQNWVTIKNDANRFLYLMYPNWGTKNDNGNLQSIQIYAGGPGPESSLSTFTTTFTYDSVNRLTSASDSGGWSHRYRAKIHRPNKR